MYPSPSKRRHVNEVMRHNIAHYISDFLDELGARKDIPYGKVRTIEQAMRLKEFANTPSDLFETPFLVYTSGYEWQEVDFVPSNLGRGYIFYFV